MNIDVSVIIVNYNTRQMTSDCINSVLKFTTNKIEIILVDNASKDGSFEFFSTDERVKYIYSPENLGFGRANNLGAESAVGKYIFLLNSDTLLLDDVIRKLFSFSEVTLNNKFGALGTRLVDEKLQDIFSFSEFLTFKRLYGKLGEILKIHSKDSNELIYRNLEEHGFALVDFVSGANLFMSRELFLTINGFDPDFFMYYEETDLQLRLVKSGMYNYVLNVKDIIHLEGGSFGTAIPFRRKMMMVKGSKTYIKKHFRGISKFHISLLVFLILIKDLLKLNYSKAENWKLIKEVLK